jgi:hypothetical protein
VPTAELDDIAGINLVGGDGVSVVLDVVSAGGVTPPLM